MSTKVIYHRADFDGIFCREISRLYLPDAEFIGWDYGDPIPDVSNLDTVYMLDISIDGLMSHPDLIWIDHHKSAIEKFNRTIPGYRIDGVAACRLVWVWFTSGNYPNSGYNCPLLSKEAFIDRTVIEPHAVRLAGEYDIWDKRDPNAELFQHGLRSQNLDSLWPIILQNPFTEGGDGKRGLDIITVEALLDAGRAIQYAKNRENESIIKAAGFTIKFEGLTFLACNHARYNSLLFTAGLTPEHDACLGFVWRDNGWVVSLYHAPGKEHHDLSKIAVRFGGGGHRGACGFRTSTLPFIKN